MGAKRLRLTGAEVKKFRVIKDVMDKRMRQKEAAEVLGLSTRQVRRLEDLVRLQGAKGVVHGLVGRTSNNAISPEKVERVKSLWVNQYQKANLNFTHFTEKLNEVEGIKISVESVRKILRSGNLTDKKMHRPRKHRKERPRRESAGELLQQDTSPHDWLGTGQELQLIVIVDDATSDPLYAQLFEHDGTMPNFKALEHVFRTYGLPMAIYTDKASWFHYSGQGVKVGTHKSYFEDPKEDKKVLTQIGRALDELGVEFIAAHSAPAKGRVERMNRTFQDRLISELRLRKIKNIDVANVFIEDVFLPDFRKRFRKAPKSPRKAFVELFDPKCLRNILCAKYTSTVRPDNIIARKGLYKIQLLPAAHRANWAKAKVEVSIHTDGTLSVVHEKTREAIPHEVIECKKLTEFKNGSKRNTHNVSD